ncbi:MAG: LLM class oxidoreductase [Marinobacter sp.]|nr:LLM class oxidoreductase [Marinobacter sp.]
MSQTQPHPSLLSAPTTAGFRRVFAPRKLTCGLFFPIAAYRGDMPELGDQTTLAAKADEGGFAALWSRDVPLRDPDFGDVGQILDPWVWMTYMLPFVRQAALATGSLILPLRHPIHLAKAAASLDTLSGGRLMLGLASGDRAIEFPAFGVDHAGRGDRFREGFRYLEALLGETYPVLRTSLGELSGADLVPKPAHGRLPLGITGGARQTPGWVAEHADFWLTYPRPLQQMAQVMAQWRQSVHEAGAQLEKPVAQSLYIDLAEDPDESPKPIHLGYRLGRNWLIQLLGGLQEIGVNHVAFILRFSRRPAAEVLDELIAEVIPTFPAH